MATRSTIILHLPLQLPLIFFFTLSSISLLFLTLSALLFSRSMPHPLPNSSLSKILLFVSLSPPIYLPRTVYFPFILPFSLFFIFSAIFIPTSPFPKSPPPFSILLPSLLRTQLVNPASKCSLLQQVIMWLIAILCGMLVGKVLIHGLIFKRILRLKMFRDEQVRAREER